MAVIKTSNPLAQEAASIFRSAMVELEAGRNPAMKAALGDIGKAFASASAQIQHGAPEARAVAKLEETSRGVS